MALRTALSRRARNNYWIWRHVLNGSATRAFKADGATSNSEVRRIVADLRANGIAMSSVGALMNNESCFRELASAAEALLPNSESYDGEKDFLRELLGQKPVLDPNSVFARFALMRPMLDVANHYFGMQTLLRYYNVWLTPPNQTAARQSQLWHRDREDRQILKVFVYLSDVDESAGPFTYAPGTHMLGRIRQEPDGFMENGVRRTTDEQMAAVVSPEKWIYATGPKGVIVFADTRGYHKGGLAKERQRFLYACGYTSPASQSADLFDRSAMQGVPINSFALSPPLTARK